MVSLFTFMRRWRRMQLNGHYTCHDISHHLNRESRVLECTTGPKKLLHNELGRPYTKANTRQRGKNNKFMQQTGTILQQNINHPCSRLKWTSIHATHSPTTPNGLTSENLLQVSRANEAKNKSLFSFLLWHPTFGRKAKKGDLRVPFEGLHIQAPKSSQGHKPAHSLQRGPHLGSFTSQTSTVDPYHGFTKATTQ